MVSRGLGDHVERPTVSPSGLNHEFLAEVAMLSAVRANNHLYGHLLSVPIGHGRVSVTLLTLTSTSVPARWAT